MLGTFAVLAAGATLRIVALWDDFWLDEIWSLRLATMARTPIEILGREELLVDNNHLLNTLFLYLLGEQSGWIPYRLLALASGLATLFLVVRIGSRRGPRSAFTLALVFSISYLLVAYSAEARGYAPAILFAFAARALLAADSKGWMSPLAFSACVILGFLSHFVFGHVYLGLLCWSLWRTLRRPERRSIARLALWHALPLAFAAMLYVVFLRRIVYGGAPEASLSQTLGHALAWTFGSPETTFWGVALAVVALAALAHDVLSLHREGSDEWVFQVVTVVIAPLLTLVLFSPPFLLPRYFLIPIAFLLLSIARSAGRLLEGGVPSRVVGAVLLLALVGGNVAYIVPFLRWGRGEFAAAVDYMADRSPNGAIVVGSDEDFRGRMVLNFYGRRLPEGKSLRYVPQDQLDAIRPDWFVVQGKEDRTALLPRLAFPNCTYTLERQFRYAGPTGYHLWLYRLDRA